MTIQYFGVTALQTQPGLASDWLRNMSSAAYDAGITLTLSKALPSILMEASRYPAVIQVCDIFLTVILEDEVSSNCRRTIKTKFLKDGEKNKIIKI